MTTPPTGTVTFLFTDIEGSTRRWERDRAAMERALARHNAILERAIAAHHGHVFKTVGDAYCASFGQAGDAVAAAIDAQRALQLERWDEVGPGFEPLRVRMGLHTGLVELKDGDYFGRPVNRVARLMAAAHGGQILLSLATEQLVRDALPDGAKLVDLGLHRLKDLEYTEHLFRLVAPGFPDATAPPETAEALSAGSHPLVDVESLPSACPYRGLFAFREEDAPFFFGREAFTELLVNAVSASPMVGVIGPSGSGKSSVIFAGLAPQLRAANGRVRWHIAELRPGSRPFHALAGTLLPLYEQRELTETDRLAETNKLAGFLKDGSVAPKDVLVRIGDKRQDLGGLLLVADQFEELYTLCQSDDEQRAFQDLLFAAAFEQNGGLPFNLALTLRADFMGHALAYRPFADAIQKHDVKLGPMNREELGRAVRLPAEKQGRAFESGLVERIVDDVGETVGSLPLLEFALTRLWDLQEAGWLTHDAYERIGRVEGAVARHADAVFAGLAADEQLRSRRVFVQLVQPGEGTEDTRRLATRDEIGDDWPLVQKLADARLVSTGRDGAGHETAEVVHEALIRSWGKLREWMNGDRAFRSWQERLRFALRQWEATGLDEGALMRGAPLAEAEGWLKERGGELGAAERRFIQEGVSVRDAEQRARQRQLEREAESARGLRRRAVLLSGALLASGVLGLTALAFSQQSQENAKLAGQAQARAEQLSKLAFARELASSSQANLNQDPERAALLALVAISTSIDAEGRAVPEAEQALHLALQHTRLRYTITAHAGGVKDIAVSSDRSRVATCGKDGIKLWALGEQKPLLAITDGMTTVNTVAFSPDNSLLASGGPDGVARLWDANKGAPVRTMPGHQGEILQVVFSPDGSELATASRDKTVKIWSVSSGAELSELVGHSSAVSTVAWRPDGRQLATGSDDRTVGIWDRASGDRRLTIGLELVSGVAYSPDGSKLATAGAEARLWDPQTGDFLNVLAHHDDYVKEIAFSPDGQLVLTASADKTAGIFPSRPVGSLLGGPIRLAGHQASVGDVAFTSDGQQALTASSDGTVKVWDLTPGQAWRTLRRHGKSVPGVTYSPDGKRIATAGRDGVAKIWDFASATALVTFTGHTSDVLKVAFSPDGQTLATSSNDGTAKLWNSRSGQLLRTMEGYTLPVTALAFDPEGARLATASKDMTIKLWDTQSGQSLLTLDSEHSDAAQSVQFSHDGRFVAAGSKGGTITIWEAASGSKVQVLDGHNINACRVRFSPDDRQLAVAYDNDRLVKLWDIESGREVFSIPDHVGPVQGLDFSPDGTKIATSSWDGTVRIWDRATGHLVLKVAEAATQLVDLDYSPDGEHIVVGALNGTAYVYTLDVGELVDLAHQRVTRTLTDEECRVFLHRESCSAMP